MSAIIDLLDEKQAHDLNFKFLNLLEKEGIAKEKELLFEGKCVRKIRRLNKEVGDKIVRLSYVKFSKK
tara:strand:- start:643 stop:846 length:204 start_codon:yes stop_codon:yes gene_type:complete